MLAQYPFREIEPRWQKIWDETKLSQAPEKPDKKYYVIPMFAYPSGDIHMGHFRNYIITDAIARFRMMQGFDVLHAFGWDAFGLPAENAAIKHGIHPETWTLNNIEVSRQTLKRCGISFDWSREVTTCQPDYYKWTQWLFLQLFKYNLAYQATAMVNWCPVCQTVLANEQVETGNRCWRGHQNVTRREMEGQWFFKITAYAERLLQDLDKLDGWPENVKTIQRNWIGKSKGVLIDFQLQNSSIKIPVFTTRPDTIYGVTFIAIAPESPLLKQLKIDPAQQPRIEAYIQKAYQRSEIERTAADIEKDGVFTGAFAINPLSGEKVQLWVADYVLVSYGTGAVMGVPAHDQRDFLFARKYNIPLKVVIAPIGEPATARIGEESLDPANMKEAFVDYGRMINSGQFNGKVGKFGIEAVNRFVEENRLGKVSIQYKLRDWLISRQRYWGCPIPIIHCPEHGAVAVPEKDLPVLLPKKVSFRSTDQKSIPEDNPPKAGYGGSPIADIPEFVITTCPECGKPAQREVNTMDTFVCSAWYHLRYTDAHNNQSPFSKEKLNTWMPIDIYVGGIQHATGHLLYFRFITKFLHDLGLIKTDEPALVLFNHGMVLDEAGQVMSKSLGNVVSPLELFDREGVDVARCTMFFAAPADKEILWSTEGVVGSARFLSRIWRLFESLDRAGGDPLLGGGIEKIVQSIDLQTLNPGDLKLYRKLNQTIRAVTEDFERMQFNTALAALMELINEIPATKPENPLIYYLVLVRLIQSLAPLAPHIAEELWHRAGFSDSIFRSRWPNYDPDALTTEEVTIAVQINGRLRATFAVPTGSSEEIVTNIARNHNRITPHLSNKKVLKTVYITDKLLNFVVE